jgi:hypothetical protein
MTKWSRQMFFKYSFGERIMTEITFEMIRVKSFSHRRHATTIYRLLAMCTRGTYSLKIMFFAVGHFLEFKKFGIFKWTAAGFLTNKTFWMPVTI